MCYIRNDSEGHDQNYIITCDLRSIIQHVKYNEDIILKY